MTSQTAPRLRTIFGLSLVLILLLAPASALAQGPGPAQEGGTGFYYVVRPGDTWTGIAHTVGIPVSTIKKYNPAAIHPHDYLWIGDRLWIPGPEPSHVTTGYWYNVKQGNDWNYVSKVTGVPVSVLKAANPIAAADPHGWLYIGQKLWIPTGSPAQAQPGAETLAPSAGATAESAEASTAISPEATASSSEALTGTAALATAVAGAAELGATTPAAAASSTEAPAMAVVGTPTPSTGPEATPVPLILVEPTGAATEALAAPTTAVETVSPEATASATSGPVSAPSETPAASASEQPAAACPADPAAYPVAIAERLNGSSGDLKALKDWLGTCGVITAKSGDAAEIAIPGVATKDVTVVIQTTPAGKEPHGQVFIYHSTTTGYVLAYQAEGAGDLKLLKAEDINGDGKPDLVYSDTSCGAHTCFSTLSVVSWNGSEWQDWIKGQPTMAGAEYSFQDTVSAGEGQEILAHGGIINSAGAGPQRAWTETYISPEGGPYESYKKAYDASDCLYFQILDANDLFNRWASIGFAPAIAAYDKAVADQAAKACSTQPDVLNQLRDFSRFRLVVSWVSRGRTDKAAEVKTQMTYQPLIGAADTFLLGLTNSRSIVQACRDTTKYAEQNPDSWNYLSDWGYANPTFTAADLCPLGE
jgi:LysM repeat protein